jgi:transposase
MPRMADALAHLRRLAIRRVDEGRTPVEVARFLGVTDRSVRRWLAARRSGGDAALQGRPHSGRPPKLTEDRAIQVLSWLNMSPCDFGFPTQRWTAPRVAELISREFGLRMNHRYLNEWLLRRGITPQIPKRIPRERDDDAVRRWVRNVWPRIKKKRANWTRISFLPMKPAF